MSTFEILMPKMGESVEEATITKWFVSEGDTIQEDDVLLEIATDKVDSEIPSPVAGTVKEIKYKTDDVVPVGVPVAVILLEGAEDTDEAPKASASAKSAETPVVAAADSSVKSINITSDRFFSPLVRSIADSEGISIEELETISGTGKEGRVTKNDILGYLKESHFRYAGCNTCCPSQTN